MPIILAVEAEFPLGCNEKLLDHSILLATSVEHMAAVTGYRFHVTYAHHSLIERLIGELRQRMSACRRSAVSWTPLPACDADLDFAPERLGSLSQRTTRASDLLRTGIDIITAEQHPDLLRSMDQRVHLQLLLNEATEGMSVVITYYALYLIGYVLKSLKPFDLGMDPDVVTGLAFPIVFALVWLNVRCLRKKLLP